MYNVWQDIKDKLTVEEVLSDYLTINPNGANYKALCPFHREKTPSLIINSDKQVWHCFGCGAGGDIFAFVTQIENITKKQALEKLAKKANIKLESTFKENTDNEVSKIAINVTKYERGLKILDWAADLYNKVLIKILADRNSEISKYCIERGFDQEIIQKFSIGYAPRANFLLNLATKYQMDLDIMEEIGLLKINNDVIRNQKSYKDKFADRLIIPIKNQESKVVGFTGRVLPYDNIERPKYLNSPQSEWFNKSEIWFGLNIAKKSIFQERKAIVVEGNMDVIAAFSHGFYSTIASQGTSFTLQQLNILKSLTSIIWLAYDNDEAGRLAELKLFKEATKMNFEVLKLIIPKEYKDIDEYLQGNPDAQLKAINYLDYLIQTNYNLLISTDKKQQRQSILDLLEIISMFDNLVKEQYLQELSRITKISFITLQNLALEITKKKQISPSEENISPIETSSALGPEQTILVSWQNLIAANLSVELISSQTLEQMFKLLKNFVNSLKEYDNFATYLKSEAEILSLIASENPETKTKQMISKQWRIIMHYFDTNIQQVLFEEDLKDVYLDIKNEVF